MNRRITAKDYDALFFKVNMLTEKMASFDQTSVESIEELRRRVMLLEERREPPKNIFTSDEAADYLGVSRNQLYYLIKSNGLPYCKMKRKMIFNRHQIDEWISNNGLKQRQNQWRQK